jgi:hypothetical protein
MFSTEDYTWTSAEWGWVLMGTFVATFLGLCGVVYLTYPDRPAVPRTFPGGLEEELGGRGAVRVSCLQYPYFLTCSNVTQALKPGEDIEITKRKLGIED